MQVYELDQDNFYVGFAELKEENKDTLNYTTVPMMIGYYKPRFNHDIQDWYEGATQEEIEEIKRQEEADKPPILQPNEMEVLKEEVIALEKENKLLKAQVEALSQTSDFHEELIVEMANKVYA